MPFVGIGVGIGRQRFAQGGIFAAYAARVAADGGVTEAGACVNAVSGISLNSSLLLVPSGYKSGVVYSEIPTNGDGDLTFTRASDATRVNSDGEIEVVGSGVPRLDYSQGSCPALLLEPQRTNLVLYSEDFGTSSWAKLQSSTITANTTISPSGFQDAAKFQASNLAFGGILRQSATITSGVIYTFSFFCKKDNYRYVGIRFNTSINVQRFPNYDFDTDTLNTQGVSGVTLSRQLYTNGWVRLILTYTATTNIGTCDIGITTANGDTATALSGTESVYVWGAQLE